MNQDGPIPKVEVTASTSYLLCILSDKQTTRVKLLSVPTYEYFWHGSNKMQKVFEVIPRHSVAQIIIMYLYD